MLSDTGRDLGGVVASAATDIISDEVIMLGDADVALGGGAMWLLVTK